MSLIGPTLPTWAPQQGGCYSGYTGRDANIVAEAAFDPERTLGRVTSCKLQRCNCLALAA